jgi:hypothetical protein
MGNFEGELSPVLGFHPINPGDPGPEIFRLIEGLAERERLQIAQVLIESHIAINVARSEGLAKIGKILGSAAQR